MLEAIQKALVQLYGSLDLWESDEELAEDAWTILEAVEAVSS